MSNKKPRRASPAVNAGSMADIAFLLLIFFLVTTTIDEDKGILARLPVWVDDELTVDVLDENVLTIQINKFDELMVENKQVALPQVPGLVAEHIRPGAAAAGTRVVSLTHDRGTSYDWYVAVYDALLMGYQDLWDQASRDRYGVLYDHLTTAEQNTIRQFIPLVISEAEPTEI